MFPRCSCRSLPAIEAAVAGVGTLSSLLTAPWTTSSAALGTTTTSTRQRSPMPGDADRRPWFGVPLLDLASPMSHFVPAPLRPHDAKHTCTGPGLRHHHVGLTSPPPRTSNTAAPRLAALLLPPPVPHTHDARLPMRRPCQPPIARVARQSAPGSSNASRPSHAPRLFCESSAPEPALLYFAPWPTSTCRLSIAAPRPHLGSPRPVTLLSGRIHTTSVVDRY